MSETWHITLVHGTFARNAAWTRPGSALREHLEARLPGRVVYHRFRWSGLPSHLARDRAARAPARETPKCVQNNETAHHCVISHSHGGNIVCYALRDAAELVERLDSIITLSTPFLLVRSQQPQPVRRTVCAGELVRGDDRRLPARDQLGARPSTPGEFFDLLREVSVNEWSYKRWIVFLIVVLMAACVSGAIKVLARWKAWLDATLAMPDLVGERLLIVRSFADEATALLVAAQFFEIVVSMFWGRSGAVDRALLSSGTWLGGRLEQWSETRAGGVFSRLVGAWTKLWFAGMAVLIPASWYFYWMQPDVYLAFLFGPYTPTARWIWGGIALLAGPFTVMLAAAAAVVLLILACGATIGLVVVLANICLSLIMLVVVPELGSDGVGHGDLRRAGAGRGHLPRPADQAAAQDRHGRDAVSLDDLRGLRCARRHRDIHGR